MVKGEKEARGRGRGRHVGKERPLSSLPFPLPKCFAHRIRETALGQTYVISRYTFP